MAIHGANILIWKGTTAGSTTTYTKIGGQRNVTINVKADTVETHTKPDFPNKTYMSSWQSWDCSFDGIFCDNDANNVGSKSLATSLVAGDTVLVQITQPGTSTAEAILSGSAIITEFSVEAPQDDIFTFSCSLQGTGALTVASVNTTPNLTTNVNDNDDDDEGEE